MRYISFRILSVYSIRIAPKIRKHCEFRIFKVWQTSFSVFSLYAKFHFTYNKYMHIQFHSAYFEYTLNFIPHYFSICAVFSAYSDHAPKFLLQQLIAPFKGATSKKYERVQLDPRPIRNNLVIYFSFSKKDCLRIF